MSAVSFSEPILHVDMDAFFVEVERLRKPGLRGRPVAVGHDGPRGVIAAASYESRAFGVHSAMPTGQAKRHCPQLLIVAPDHTEYGRVSALVFEILREFTPMVEGLSIDEAFLDVSGLRRHYPDAAAVATEIRAAIRQRLGLPASVGVASTKFVAKLASQAAKPDGIRVVSREHQQDFLDALDVAALWGVGEATRGALARLGIGRVSELGAAPAGYLERELGASLGAHLRRLARGEDERAVTPDNETKSVSAEQTFERDLRTTDEVVATLRVLADRVGSRLRRSGLVGRTVTAKMRFADFVTITRSETLSQPTDVDHEIFESARSLVMGAIDASRPVRLLGVGVSSLDDVDRPVQLTVDGDERWRSVDSAVDAVRRRYGDDSVVPARFKFVRKPGTNDVNSADH